MNPRIFIIEGPDHSGKSFLSRKLAKKIPSVLWHMTCGPGLDDPDAMALYMENAYENALDNLELGRSVIFDRHWPSDVVYSYAMKRPTCGVCEDLEAKFDNIGATYIFCIASDAVRRFKQKKDPDHVYDDAYDERTFRKIVNGYRDFYDARDAHCCELNLERPFLYDLVMYWNRSHLVDTFLEAIVNRHE